MDVMAFCPFLFEFLGFFLFCSCLSPLFGSHVLYSAGPRWPRRPFRMVRRGDFNHLLLIAAPCQCRRDGEFLSHSFAAEQPEETVS